MSSEVLDTKSASFLRAHVHHLAFTNVPERNGIRCTFKLHQNQESSDLSNRPEPCISSIDTSGTDRAPLSNLGQLCDDPGTRFGLMRAPVILLGVRPVYPSPEGIPKPTFGVILALCKPLEVLVRLVGDEQDAANYPDFGDDVRAVTPLTGMFLRDWETGILDLREDW
ncbi:hypothetical protein C8R45DRAFT_156711 [Mycena sanguinolenta]|nr:hypothetical protein C8R45DRAFT_156711 [Mycena sanguinolenta]